MHFAGRPNIEALDKIISRAQEENRSQIIIKQHGETSTAISASDQSSHIQLALYEETKQMTLEIIRLQYFMCPSLVAFHRLHIQI